MTFSTTEQQYGLDSLESMITHQLGAIRICLQCHHYMPAIILMYTMMDNVASLFRHDLTRDVCRTDFEDWVSRYLLPDSSLSCSAADLYAARCGTVHTYSPQSSRSRRQKVREILYAWGQGTEGELGQLIQEVYSKAQAPQSWPVAVHVDNLYYALEQSVKRAREAMAHDQALTNRVLKAALEIFSLMPVQDAGDLIARLRGTDIRPS